MPNTPDSPNQLVSRAIQLRAESFRRWREAADAKRSRRDRRLYEALAAFECERFDRLIRRFRPHPDPVEASLASFPTLELPRGAVKREPLRAAKVAAEAERRTWANLLRRTPRQDPLYPILTDLVDDARRSRDLVQLAN